MTDEYLTVDPTLNPPPPRWKQKELVYQAVFFGFFLGMAYFVWIWWFAESLIPPPEMHPDAEGSMLEFID